MKHTEETKQKLSRMRRGKLNPMYGRKHTDEAKRKIGLGTRRINAKRQYALEPMRLKPIDDHAAGYLAGIIDGEGSISFKRGRPSVTVYGNSDALMQWLLENVGGSVLWNCDKRGRTPGHAWNVGAARDVYALCCLMWPLLLIKQDVASEVIAFLETKYGGRIDG